MKQQFLLVLLLSFFTLQSYTYKPTMPFVAVEAHASYLAEKLNINNAAVMMALTGYEKLKQRGLLANPRYLTIADFSKPSNEERLYLIDMEQEEMVLQTLVAHGRNTGTLFAKYFSNKNESYQSSLGFYITGKPYQGKHGVSLELIGVEAGINNLAKKRAIVLHGADYVSNSFIAKQGYIGRSLGCPAVPNELVNDIIETIQGESCLFIYAPNQQYLKKSTLIR